MDSVHICVHIVCTYDPWACGILCRHDLKSQGPDELYVCTCFMGVRRLASIMGYETWKRKLASQSNISSSSSSSPAHTQSSQWSGSSSSASTASFSSTITSGLWRGGKVCVGGESMKGGRESAGANSLASHVHNTTAQTHFA